MRKMRSWLLFHPSCTRNQRPSKVIKLIYIRIVNSGHEFVLFLTNLFPVWCFFRDSFFSFLLIWLSWFERPSMKLELDPYQPGIIFYRRPVLKSKWYHPSMTIPQRMTLVNNVFSSCSSTKKFLMSLHRSSRICVIVLRSPLVLLL
jgi:hypothetical protein